MPWLTGSAIPVPEKCRIIRVPDDPIFVAAVSGALLELTYPHNWEKFGTLTPEEMAQAFIDVYAEFADSDCVEPETMGYPTTFQNLPHLFRQAGNQTVTPLYQNSNMYSVVCDQPTNQIGTEFATDIFIAKGRWEMKFVVWRTTTSAIVNILIDDVLALNVDLYNTPNQSNIVQTFAGDKHILTDGIHEIKVVVTGKRAASTNFKTHFITFFGRKFADLP